MFFVGISSAVKITVDNVKSNTPGAEGTQLSFWYECAARKGLREQTAAKFGVLKNWFFFFQLKVLGRCIRCFRCIILIAQVIHQPIDKQIHGCNKLIPLFSLTN